MIRDRLPRPIRRAGRWAKQQINPRGMILMYHRIAEERFDPWNLCVTPENFSQQLEVLKSSGLNVMHLHELAASLSSGKIPKRSVVLTFDDGYLDNLENGRPILERYGIPATVFVASGYLASEGEFWWDAMERVLLTPGKLPETLEVEVDGERKSGISTATPPGPTKMRNVTATGSRTRLHTRQGNGSTKSFASWCLVQARRGGAG